MAKRTRPVMNSRRRPSRSARRPPRRRKPPKTRTYALTTHERLSCEKCRSLPIEGSATLTIDASRTTTNWAAASSAMASHLLVLLEDIWELLGRMWNQSSGSAEHDTERRFRFQVRAATPLSGIEVPLHSHL